MSYPKFTEFISVLSKGMNELKNSYTDYIRETLKNFPTITEYTDEKVIDVKSTILVNGYEIIRSCRYYRDDESFIFSFWFDYDCGLNPCVFDDEIVGILKKELPDAFVQCFRTKDNKVEILLNYSFI